MKTARQAAAESLWRTQALARQGDMAAKFCLLRLSLCLGEPEIAGRAAACLASLRSPEATGEAAVIPLPLRAQAPCDVEMVR